MISAIVFLPLIGFLIAGMVALIGRHGLIAAALGSDHDPYAPGGHGPSAVADDSATHGQDEHHAPEAPGARFAEVLTTGLLMITAVLSWAVFIEVGVAGDQAVRHVEVLRFIHVGAFVADWALRVDPLTAVMLVVVTTVSALVHLYSIGYMSHDPHRPRFFAYLSLFTFAMLMLVTADNFVQLFFGWEGVGLASYLLIGFWFEKPSANAAAIKAFIVNRIGDFGFALGIFGVFTLFGTVSFDAVFASAPAMAGKTMPFLGAQVDALTCLSLLLFVGAMGKSAQFLLHTWLPDAMEGPTPVSALIHAATMVTAGVFMVARLSPLMRHAPHALAVITIVGSITAFFAATVGLVQNDIKRVVAYSTCSQLGYMFAALGVGAYSVAIFHLFTHAFFKALLFLGSGSVIHAVSGEQDMRKMGALGKKIPVTYWMMVIGTLALTGFGLPFIGLGFAGFYSKDAIIEATFASNSAAGGFGFALLVIAALMTSFYSWRLIFMVFHGSSRVDADVEGHIHESPLTMMIPLAVLALGATVAGLAFYGLFVDPHGVETFFRDSLAVGQDNPLLHALHEVPAWVSLSPFVMMLAGFGLAWLFYIRRPELPAQLARNQPILYNFLLNKWYFDEIYDVLFVRSTKWLGRFLWKRGDGWLIDGFGPDGVAARVLDVTRGVVRLQTGYLYHYAFAMLMGVAALATWYIFAGGAR